MKTTHPEALCLITKEAARALKAVRNGFEPYEREWWHFTLKDEPYPDTYFEFPVSSDYLRR